MNNSYQAKTGFKTFIITLVISLVVFSSLYYIATSSGSDTSVPEDGADKQTSMDTNENTNTDTNRKVASAEDYSVFEVLAAEDTKVSDTGGKGGAVLAGADESTESTVPDTGSNTMMVASVMGIGLLSFAGYILINNPRKLALSTFEKKATKDL